MDTKRLKGIAVVSVQDGEKVGTVDDLLFNPETRKVLAFRLSRTGLFGSSREIILMSDVDNIGQDAVMIPNRNVVRPESEERELLDRPGLKQLGNLRVVSHDGTYVGTVATIHIDQKTGEMSRIDVGGGDLMKMFRSNIEVPATEIVSMGADVVVIPDRYAPDHDHVEEEQDQPPESDSREVIQ